MHRVLQLLLRVLHQFLHLFEHIAQCRLSLCYICLHVCNDVNVCFGYFGDNSMDDAQAQAESEQKHVDSGADACTVCDQRSSSCERRGGAGRCASKHTILLLLHLWLLRYTAYDRQSVGSRAFHICKSTVMHNYMLNVFFFL